MTSGLRDVVQTEWEDVVEAIEKCYELGWTDGLPVVPPTGRAGAGNSRLHRASCRRSTGIDMQSVAAR